ncbi:MAG: EAL domain-containing protein [Lachnospiraceae bacterium]|nr:EAL domain-containing protein [Lachnospiraceae bacterium]
MSWNFDFDISAILITTTLIIYFAYRKWLPLLSNRLFLLLMGSSVAVAISDVIASVISVKGARFPIVLLYFVNMIYYVLLAFKPMVFCYYVCSLSKLSVGKISYKGGIILSFPFLAAVAVMLSSPWSKAVFYITENHEFLYGELRPVMFYTTVSYLIMSAIVVLTRKNKFRKVMRYSIFVYILFTLMGHIYQVYFNPYLQTVSLGSTIGILIIFLAFQNPDYDRERKTGMFRENSIRKLKEEDFIYGIRRAVVELAFENYGELRAVYGEELASELCHSVATFLRESFPTHNQFYVHNGRFAMIFDGDTEKLQTYCELVIKRCKNTFIIGSTSFYLSPVFAYMLEDIDAENQEVLRDSLKIAIEKSLKKGRGSIVRLTEDMHQQALRERRVENALKKALKEDSLQVYYQPIYSTKDMKITGAEALVRIVDDELGLLFPDEFVGKAEKNGSILTLGEQVFKKVCAFVRNHDMEALGISFIEVNLSPLQCMREKLSVEFEQIMEDYGVDPKYIGLEITESAASNIDVIKDNMNHLVDVGVKLALDDYGTGYSNLINILSLPLSIVKIDKSIVWAYFNDGNDFLLRVIQTFENKNLHLIVEGVETKEMAEKLEEMGCHYEQGYYYSKPIPEDAFLKYIEASQNKPAK